MKYALFLFFVSCSMVPREAKKCISGCLKEVVKNGHDHSKITREKAEMAMGLSISTSNRVNEEIWEMKKRIKKIEGEK